MKSKRQQIREKRRQQQRMTRIIWIAGAVVVVAGIAVLAWIAFRPSIGQAVAVMPNSEEHLPDGAVPGPYNSDPPTSGPHYASDLPANFYNEADLAGLPEHPEGFLVHNLEHGYVIFWYDCQEVPEGQCDNLKGQIQTVMDQFNGVKLIAFPWESIEVPVAMTSWGRIQEFASFDAQLAMTFVERNRNRAPEPNAP